MSLVFEVFQTRAELEPMAGLLEPLVLYVLVACLWSGTLAESCKGVKRTQDAVCNEMITFEARKGIPKNLSSQVLGEVRVNFWG